jgi:hypothetical protein
MLQLIFPLAAAELESTPHIPLGRGGLGPGTKLEIVRAYHGVAGLAMQINSQPMSGVGRRQRR